MHPSGRGMDPAQSGSYDVPEMLRTYQAWKGSNVFCLNGRLIFGPDVRSLPLTIFLIVAPVIVFCVFVGRKLMDEFHQKWGISIIVVAAVLTVWILIVLLLTSSRDPGIIPRNTHPPELEGDEQGSEVRPGLTPQRRLPRTKDLVVNGITVKIKYCDTCMLYRPARCSHCSICDNCVERFDHHCPWVGQCIGVRNYRFFYMFVTSSTLLCMYVHVFCWIYVTKIMNAETINIGRALIKTPASIALIVYSFIAIWFVGGLTVFHFYLISTNQSTYENFRYRYDRRANPYNRGVIENFKEVFFTSIQPSKNKFRAKVPREPEIQPRIIGGGGIEKLRTELAAMGNKSDWEEEAEEVGRHGVPRNDGNVGLHKDSEFMNESSDLSWSIPIEGTEDRGGSHPRISSWRRKSEHWDISSDTLGDSKRASAGSVENFTADTRR